MLQERLCRRVAREDSWSVLSNEIRCSFPPLTGLRHVSQERRDAITIFLQVVLKGGENGIHLAHADSICPLDRPEGMVRTEFHCRVNVLRGSDLLLQGECCLVDDLTENARQDHPDTILHKGHFFSHRMKETLDDVESLRRRKDRRCDFDEWFQHQSRQNSKSDQSMLLFDPARLFRCRD